MVRKLTSIEVLIFLILSLFLFNIYAVETTTFYFDKDRYALKQSIFILIGLMIGYSFYYFITKSKDQVRSLKRFYFINIIFVILTLIFSVLIFVLPESILPTIKGAKRWIKVYGFSIAPIEIMKLSYIFIFTHIFSSDKYSNNLSTKNMSFFTPVFIIFVIYLIIVTIKQKDLGNFFLFSSVFVTMILIFFNRLRLVFQMLFLGIIGLIAVIVTSQHRINRVMQWFEASTGSGAVSSNYQVQQGLFAISDGGFFGSGPGTSIMKLGYIPEPHTDMVIPIILNEIGIFGLFAYIITILSFFILIILKAKKINNIYLFNFSLISFFIICYQMLINLFGVLGVMPLKGINVPFLSYGGSSTIMLIILIFLNMSLMKILSEKKEVKA